MGATIPHQVELDVAPPTVQLEFPLTLGIRCVLSTGNNGQVGFQKRVSHRLHQSQVIVGTQLRKIIEKNAPDPTLLRAVLQIEVFIAPGLETWVFISTKGRQGVLATTVKVRCNPPQNRKWALNPFRHRTSTRTSHLLPLLPTCAHSCERLEHKDCVDERPSDTPMASNDAPTNSGRCCVAEGGSFATTNMRKTTTRPLKHLAALKNLGYSPALQWLIGRLHPCIA